MTSFLLHVAHAFRNVTIKYSLGMKIHLRHSFQQHRLASISVYNSSSMIHCMSSGTTLVVLEEVCVGTALEWSSAFSDWTFPFSPPPIHRKRGWNLLYWIKKIHEGHLQQVSLHSASFLIRWTLIMTWRHLMPGWLPVITGSYGTIKMCNLTPGYVVK